jgi:hypothetical protein
LNLIILRAVVVAFFPLHVYKSCPLIQSVSIIFVISKSSRLLTSVESFWKSLMFVRSWLASGTSDFAKLNKKQWFFFQWYN